MSSTMVSSALLITAKVKGSSTGSLDMGHLPLRRGRFQLRDQIAMAVRRDRDAGGNDDRAVIAFDQQRPRHRAGDRVPDDDRNGLPCAVATEPCVAAACSGPRLGGTEIELGEIELALAQAAGEQTDAGGLDL